MIIRTFTDSNPYTYTSLGSTLLDTSTLPTYKVKETNDICSCDFPEIKECPLVVFADISSADYWKNDQYPYLYRKLVATDTVVIKLYKDGNFLTNITDNTYGQYESNLSPIQPLYVYFLHDFQATATLLGFGLYQIKTEVTITGVTDTIEGPLFKLEPYSDQRADGTLKIESYQNGNILRSPFDYTGLNLYWTYRIDGTLTKEPSKETENYLTQDYKRGQIQDKIIDTWTINTGLVGNILTKQLIYGDMLANRFLITAYDIYADEIYRQVPLYPTEISEYNNYSKNPNKAYSLKFVDKFDDIIKRNF